MDFRYFWGGLSSCKRPFLVNHGLFDQRFEFGCEDVELAYRLSHHRLKVIFNQRAIQYVNRPTTFDEFCSRCHRQGQAQWAFSRLHDNPIVQKYCDVACAEERWASVQHELTAKVRRVHQLEAWLESATTGEEASRDELWQMYKWTFNTFKIKGIVEAMRRGERAGYS